MGLTSEEARRRYAELGPNALPDAPKPALWRRFVRQFRSSLIYVLLFALAVDQVVWWLDGAVGIPFESIAIAAILLLNAGMGVFQEYRAEDALARLRELEAPQVWVLRNERLERIPSSEVVPGDAVRVESGARIVADGCLDGASELVVDESILTGESVPVAKGSGEEIFSGTLVVRGTAFFEVTRTGARSAMGRIAGMLGEVRSDQTPLEARLEVFGHQVARWVMGVSVVLAAVGVAVDGLERLDEAFLFAVALAVAAVPEGLPAVLTLTLALGVERMSRRKAVVRKLSAVEALGSVTVIASDKTGTLTENEMVVRDIESPDLPRALRAMVLASEAEAETGVGDPLEVSLVCCARDHGIDPIELRRQHHRQSLRAFDSEWKFMRVTVQEDGRPVSYLKGAPEVLLERCRFSDTERSQWRDRAEAHAERGYRVLALACSEGEAERDLTWLGLVLFWDPPRPEVEGALRDARAAGIRVIMITGDHPATAAAVAEQIGIDSGRIVTGEELDRLTTDELRRVAMEADVFARVAPEHKLALVDALKDLGEIVAMTG
ncbi:MAG: HAD-IC family P-type ATPase, partial [bacterium]|nr:HAD-IC family P-type ATPase [bacterium]